MLKHFDYLAGVDCVLGEFWLFEYVRQAKIERSVAVWDCCEASCGSCSRKELNGVIDVFFGLLGLVFF